MLIIREVFLFVNHFFQWARAGAYIKPLLVQCANAAVRDKTCTVFKARYESIKKRRGHKRAIIAVTVVSRSLCKLKKINL
jgi:hypothetical protein